MTQEYHIRKTTTRPKLDGDWDGPVWEKADELALDHWMGDEPEHKPDTRVKMLYDGGNLYVIFRVEDHYIRATAEKHQDPVCVDSCVEFFFTPGKDSTEGYFNLEINCGGVMLFNHQTGRGENTKIVEPADLEEISVFHSMPARIPVEQTEPTTWLLEYALPLSLLKKYAKVDRPAPGVTWEGNFYKCADRTSRPHWLTWAQVHKPGPDFHVPEDFGLLRFA